MPLTLTKEHIRYVRSVAWKWSAKLPLGGSVDDLMQEGLLALWLVAERYEEGHGATLLTFARQRIEGAMLDYMRSMNIWSRKTVQQCRLEAVAIQKLEHDLLRKPSEAEVAKELGMPLADFQHQELGHLFENSIEGFIHSAEEGGEEVNELDLLQVHDPENEPDYIVMWRERCEVLVQRIDRLKDREQEIVRMLLDDKTLADIAKKLGVTESRVCQLRQTILEKLRRQLRDF